MIQAVKPYPYQNDMIGDVRELLRHHRVVALVSPCGSGKTVCAAEFVRLWDAPCCLIAHRKEIVQQLAMALARLGIPHDIIAADTTVKTTIHAEVRKLGCHFYSPNSVVKVASVDTLLARKGKYVDWCRCVTLWLQDECHHVLGSNKWGRACALFPNAQGVGFTATLCRCDGKGLGSKYDGLIDAFVEGPTMRELINMGFLCDYIPYGIPNDIAFEDLHRGSKGDWTEDSLNKVMKHSKIVGDIPKTYVEHAMGLTGITFAPSIELGERITQGFLDLNVPASMITGKTSPRIRDELTQRLEHHDLLQLVNVDLFGEGYDLPEIQCASFGRPTESYGLFVQQFGRPLRVKEGKDRSLIFDHVGNIQRHKLPDAPHIWSLERRDRRKKTEDRSVPVTVCPKCGAYYERIYKRCPYCGYESEPGARATPKMVDGDLEMISPEELARMRGEIAKVDGDVLIPSNVDEIVTQSIKKNHRMRKASQETLRSVMGWWAAFYKQDGDTDSEIQRRFYLRFGTDVMSARALGRPKAKELSAKITDEIGWLTKVRR